MENQDMGFAEKLCEAMEQNHEKQDSLHSLMGLLGREWDDTMLHMESTKAFMAECFTELETREKRLKLVQESARRDVQEFDLRRVYVEEGLKKLDEKEKLLNKKRIQLEEIRDFLDLKMKYVACQEQHIQGLLETREIELTEQGKLLNRKEDELSLEEDVLDCRRDALKSKGNDLDSKERSLKRRGDELDSVQKRLLRKGKCLEEKEDDLKQREERLDEKETKLFALQKNLEGKKTELDTLQDVLKIKGGELESLEKHLERWKNELSSVDCDVVRREKEVALKENNLGKFEQELEALREKIVNLGSELVSFSKCSYQFVEQQRSIDPNRSIGTGVAIVSSKRLVDSTLEFGGSSGANGNFTNGKNKKSRSMIAMKQVREAR